MPKSVSIVAPPKAAEPDADSPDSFVKVIVPPITAAADEDKVPASATEPDVTIEASFVKVTVSPITIGDDEDNVPFVIVTEPWLTKEPVSVAPA